MRLIYRLLTILFLSHHAVLSWSYEHSEQPSVHNIEVHNHGIATLTLVMEGNELAIEFKSPAANIVGFEHKARTLKEKQRIDRAEALLSDHRKLFMFDGSTCTLQKVEVDTLSVVSESRHHLDHHGRQDHSHHGNVGSNYQFTCKNLYKIRSISIRLQAYFEQIETLNVMWLNGIRQGLETLKASNNTIHFEKVR